uniref:Uncharacterized protein n=1 Tax=Marseillevirus LCMAC101 TaxID=2506602 RepID=A0A481YRJ6_9VIRU|nr:MAG: uncharacterized protein LCMAC101_01340 [Marseillevirus LCMAC101]
MISAFEITGIILLAIGVGLVIWWYMEAGNYDAMLDGVPFAKGANLIYDPDGTDADNTVKMSCPDGKQVCVYQATQICTFPDSYNFEHADTDPINRVLTSDGWGKFNPKTTRDLTAEMNTACKTANRKPVSTDNCQYTFSPSNTFTTTDGSVITCSTVDPSAIHLIAAYTCQPVGTVCNSTGPAPS